MRSSPPVSAALTGAAPWAPAPSPVSTSTDAWQPIDSQTARVSSPHFFIESLRTGDVTAPTAAGAREGLRQMRYGTGNHTAFRRRGPAAGSARCRTRSVTDHEEDRDDHRADLDR